MRPPPAVLGLQYRRHRPTATDVLMMPPGVRLTEHIGGVFSNLDDEREAGAGLTLVAGQLPVGLGELLLLNKKQQHLTAGDDGAAAEPGFMFRLPLYTRLAPYPKR